jgi:hypothetical protein
LGVGEWDWLESAEPLELGADLRDSGSAIAEPEELHQTHDRSAVAAERSPIFRYFPLSGALKRNQ